MNINFTNILVLLSAALAVAVLYILASKKVKFSFRVLIAMALGVVAGLIFGEDVLIIRPLGSGYASLIKMIVVPLVMVSIISSIMNLKDIKALRTMGLKAIFFLLITTGLSSALGIVVGRLFNVGNGMSFTPAEGYEPRVIPEFSQVILDMLPTNPFAAMVNGNVIAVMIFSMFIAIAMLIEGNRKPESIKPFKDLIKSLSNIFIRVTKMVLKLTPYGVFALIATAVANNGLSTLLPLGTFIIAVYAGNVLIMLLIHTPLVATLGKRNPIEFFKGIGPAQIVAFTTQSSYGTLPVTIQSLIDNVRVPKSIATFVASLGASMGMNSCGGLYPAIVAIFIGNVMNVDMTMGHYTLIVFAAIIGSIGVAGVPGAATIATTVVLTSIGFPVEAMAMVLAVDAIVDMGRTLTNITGASVAALLVAETSKGEIVEGDSEVA
ncbi:MAG: dicarboxylate/amino acid:cation symporter [Clostridiaceae bacterium]